MNPHAQGTPPGAQPDVSQGVSPGISESLSEAVPEYHVWQIPGKPVAVHIRFDAIERLSVELMRGYGALPKRNAEAGGVLRGTVLEGSPTIVRVEDFEAVPCEHRRGPSYIFTEEDCVSFQEAGLRPGAIGYFRGHTRDGLALGTEDIDLLDHCFPGPAAVALLVKPYGMKASIAGIFIRESGVFPETSPLEFPFRRQELTGQGPPVGRSLPERLLSRDGRSRRRGLESSAAPSPGSGSLLENAPLSEPAVYGDSAQHPQEHLLERDAPPTDRNPQPAMLAQPEAARAKRKAPSLRAWTWVWLPLSFAFMVLGGVLGYQLALSVGSRAGVASPADFSLSLSVTKIDQNLSLHWDRLSPAVRASQRGVLEIEEEGVAKRVDLTVAQLQNGTLIYRNSTNDVRFKLTVFPKEGVSVTESAEWKQ